MLLVVDCGSWCCFKRPFEDVHVCDRSVKGAIAEYPVEIEAGGKGLASTRQISSVAGSLSEAISYEMATRSWIIERGNF